MVNPYCLSHEDNAVTVRLTKTPYGYPMVNCGTPLRCATVN